MELRAAGAPPAPIRTPSGVTIAGPGHERPLIAIDAGSPVPPYEQLRAQLARQVQERTLAVGTRLPTVRRLAADLGLAVNTVGRAYRELEEAGLIETRGRAGSFVAAGEQGRERARQAAADFAAVVNSVGLDPAEALSIIQAALGLRPT